MTADTLCEIHAVYATLRPCNRPATTQIRTGLGPPTDVCQDHADYARTKL